MERETVLYFLCYVNLFEYSNVCIYYIENFQAQLTVHCSFGSVNHDKNTMGGRNSTTNWLMGIEKWKANWPYKIRFTMSIIRWNCSNFRLPCIRIINREIIKNEGKMIGVNVLDSYFPNQNQSMVWYIGISRCHDILAVFFVPQTNTSRLDINNGLFLDDKFHKRTCLCEASKYIHEDSIAPFGRSTYWALWMIDNQYPDSHLYFALFLLLMSYIVFNRTNINRWRWTRNADKSNNLCTISQCYELILNRSKETVEFT